MIVLYRLFYSCCPARREAMLQDPLFCRDERLARPLLPIETRMDDRPSPLNKADV